MPNHQPFAGENRSLFRKPIVNSSSLDTGSYVFESGLPLESAATSIGEMIEYQARVNPDRPFLAERKNGAWDSISYKDTFRASRRIAQALLERGLSTERPVMILSGNSIDHALLSLAGQLVGIPVAPISPAYSLMSETKEKLLYVADLVKPGLVFAASLDKFGEAFDLLKRPNVEFVTSDRRSDTQSTPISDLIGTQPGRALDSAHSDINGDTVAKYLFTSGSTGQPKGVITTHRMLCSNQAMLNTAWPFLETERLVLLDWLPWHHTFGGSFVFNLVLFNGGTLYIDEGKPTPEHIAVTIDNLNDVSPTVDFNVPAGYAQLLPYLSQDRELAEKFFDRLRLLFYAAAALPEKSWQWLNEIAFDVKGEGITMASAWGTTETSPLATLVHYPIETPKNIGVPAPGVKIKLAPVGNKTEIRVKGPNVMPGYLRQPDLSAKAFDEDGFYKTGDSAKLYDPADPSKGFSFEGRIAEDFKLSTGTWVNVGKVRDMLLSATAPLIQDCVITGHDREFLGTLVWLNTSECAKLIETNRDLSEKEILGSPEIHRTIRELIEKHNEKNSASSTKINRVKILTAPPDIDKNEITDKGYINQRAVLENRADLVDSIYSETAADRKNNVIDMSDAEVM